MASSKRLISLGRSWGEVMDSPSSAFWHPYSGSGFLDIDLFRLPPSTLAALQAAGMIEVKNEKDNFKVMFNVKNFKPDEVEVKLVDNFIVIHGKHEERVDEHGFIQREFTRRYVLPEDMEAETVKTVLSPNGVLTIEASRKVDQPQVTNERLIPIIFQQQPSVEDGK